MRWGRARPSDQAWGVRLGIFCNLNVFGGAGDPPARSEITLDPRPVRGQVRYCIGSHCVTRIRLTDKGLKCGLREAEGGSIIQVV